MGVSIYLSSSWQGPYHRDADPISEIANSPPLGLTPGNTDNINLAVGGAISVMFIENIYDLNFQHMESRAIAHELGHQFGLSHGDGAITTPGFPNMEIMSAAINGATSSDNLMDYHQNIIRSRVLSPGTAF